MRDRVPGWWFVTRGLLGSFRSKARRDDMDAARQREIRAAVRLENALASGGQEGCRQGSMDPGEQIAEPDIPSEGSRETWPNNQDGTQIRSGLLTQRLND
jgi:hypothetical protein